MTYRWLVVLCVLVVQRRSMGMSYLCTDRLQMRTARTEASAVHWVKGGEQRRKKKSMNAWIFWNQWQKMLYFWIKIAECEKEFHQWKRQSTCPQYTYSVLFSSGLKRFGPISCRKRFLGNFFFSLQISMRTITMKIIPAVFHILRASHMHTSTLPQPNS